MASPWWQCGAGMRRSADQRSYLNVVLANVMQAAIAAATIQ
jgi:hypothetical protein